MAQEANWVYYFEFLLLSVLCNQKSKDKFPKKICFTHFREIGWQTIHLNCCNTFDIKGDLAPARVVDTINATFGFASIIITSATLLFPLVYHL